MRTSLLDRQIHDLIGRIDLPDDWLDEVLGQVEDDEQLIDLRRQRDRLEAERYRLQQMRIEGDFDDNLDVYRDEMDRVRREIASLPTYDQIETLRVTGKAVQDLYQVWGSASEADQRDLLQLMLREVRVDVPNGRITSIVSLASFVSVFRKVPMLLEQDFGEFIPLWDSPDPEAMPRLRQLPPLGGGAPHPSRTLPFFESHHLLPTDILRMSPGVTESLRRFRVSTSGEPSSVVQVVFEDQSPFPLDLRHWHQASAEQIDLSGLLQRPAESVDILITQALLWDNVGGVGVG